MKTIYICEKYVIWRELVALIEWRLSNSVQRIEGM